MGVRNYLIEGLSGTGKTSVCKELQRRGHHAINGDRELAYQGDPETGKPTDRCKHESLATFTHEHHIWDVEKVKNLIASHDEPVTFSAVTQGILQNSWTYLMASLSSTLIWTP